MTPGVGLGGQKPPGLLVPEAFSLDHEPRRRWAYALREVSRSIILELGVAQHFLGLVTCGLPGVGREGDWVSLALYEDGEEARLVARTTGVRTCGSVWACPVCAPVEADRRGTALERVVARRWAAGWRVAHAVLTVRHTAGEPLREVLGALSRAWRHLVSHRRTKGLLRGWDWHRSIELTWGRNGWHPHIHLLLLVPPGVDPYVLEEPLWEAWREAVEAVGWAPSSRGGYSYQVPSSEEDALAVASYNEKTWSLPQEASLGPIKGGKGGMSPFELLAVAQQALEGEGEGALDTPGLLRPPGSTRVSPDVALALWVEYMEATKGRKRTAVSKGLRAEFHAALEAVEAEGVARVNRWGLREVVQVSVRAYLWLLRSSRLAYLLHWAEVLGSLARACELAGLVEFEEWRGVWVSAQAPPEEEVA